MEPAAVKDTALVIAFESAPGTLDPRFGIDAYSSRVRSLLFSSLLELTADGNYRPYAAKSWNCDFEALQCRFDLQSGLTFHDGSHLDAYDVEATYAAVLAPGSGSPKKAQLEGIERVEARDALTVIFDLTHASPTIPEAATLGLLPSELASQPRLAPDDLQGSGPYRISEYQSEERIHLRAFSNYQRGAPHIEALEIRVVPDAPSAAVLAGRIRGQRGLGDGLCDSVGRARPLLPAMRKLLAEHGVPEELSALPLVESGYRTGAYSHASALGMWQFTRGTGRRFLHIDHVVDERRDPLLATEAAAKYLRENYERLGSWPLAITAYNHGANGIAYAVRKLQTKNLATIVEKYRSRYFGFASRNFYSEFLAANEVMTKALETCPTMDADYTQPAQYVIDAYVALGDLAKAAGVSSSDLVALNPALASDVGSGRLRVPKGYTLKMPAASKSRFAAAYTKLPSSVRYQEQASYYASHRVRRGETLSEIASQYRTSVAALQYHNAIRDPRRLRYGAVLKVPVSGSHTSGSTGVVAARPTNHRISRGETLSHVAKRYGLPLLTLQHYNGIKDANKLAAGQVVKIPSGAAPKYRTHQVVRGQTLSHIAKLYKTSVRVLQTHNGIRDPRRLRQGQVIKVPM